MTETGCRRPAVPANRYFYCFYHTKQCKNIKHFLPFLLMFCQWCHLHSTKSFQSHIITPCLRNSYSLPQVNILFGNKRGLDVQESKIQAQRKYICKHNLLLTERGAFKVQRKKIITLKTVLPEICFEECSYIWSLTEKEMQYKLGNLSYIQSHN